jgi:DNA polymerase-3 subunit gamma/tau
MNIEISDAALFAIARSGEGSMRDAESALDQVISFSGSKIADEDVSTALGLVDLQTLNETVEAIAEQDAGRLVRIVDLVVSRGYDIRNFCKELMTHMRALLVVKLAGFDSELIQMPEGEADTLMRLSEAFSEQDLVRFFSILTKTEQDIRTSTNARFQLEIGLMKLVQSRRLYALEDAITRMAEISSKLGISGGSETNPPPSTAKPGGKAPIAGRTTRSSPTGRSSAAAAESAPPVVAKPITTQTTGSFSSTNHIDLNDPYEGAVFSSDASAEAPAPVPQPPQPSQPATLADRVKHAIERKNKRLILSALDHAESITLEGETLCVAYSEENAAFKDRIDTRENRRMIEEIYRAEFGQNVTLSVTAGQVDSAPTEKKEKTRARQKAETDPKLRALADKFRGEIVEVIKPES